MELICVIGLCIPSAIAPNPHCPQLRTHPERESLANCRSYNEWQERNNGIKNQPNVCGSLNSIYLATQQEEKYWRNFKCPLG
ncbi:MAG: hypothetical protein HC903_17595 [Methylacidiphilales bacterium]|nr:hypothetical protein [Candidatus Methylacidiphilales bacterium]NJR15734.1 hypothetical protein [Calothrix sp. CSU_2_0]